MKHKISFTVLAAVMLVSMLFGSIAVYAQDETLPAPGITPDSPFYFLDKLGKNIGMAFTFGAEAKARKALQYAEESLSEAQSMALRNKEKQIEQAAGQYEKYMAMVQARLEESLQPGPSGNVSERVALATTNHLEVLARIREQVNERAREAIANAENVSMNGQLNALRVLGENKPDKALEICDNITARQMEKIRARVNANGNSASANLTGLLDYADRIAALEDKIAATAESTGANVTALQERLANSTANRLRVLSEVYEKAPAQAQSGIANAIENSVKKYEKALEKLQTANVTAPATINATLGNIPQQLREKIQSTISNQLQINTSSSGNGTQLQVNTQTREQDRERPENGPASVPPATGATGQPGQNAGTDNQGNSKGGGKN